MANPFTILGRSSLPSKQIELFPSPSVQSILLRTDELTALCPVTQQPDYYTLTVIYTPAAVCIETKSFKLYLQTFRNEGIFCEHLAAAIADDVMSATKARHVTVTLCQHRRGGIETEVTAIRTGEAA